MKQWNALATGWFRAGARSRRPPRPTDELPGAVSAARGRRSRADMAIMTATLSAVILVTASSVAVVRSAAPDVEAAALDAPMLVSETGEAVVPSTTTLPAAATTETAPPPPAPLPAPSVPVPPPTDERAPTPIVQVGEIRIPKIGLVHPVYEGVTLTVIDRGPGHWPGSAMPGQLGNTVFAGHRTTKTKPFRNIDRLVPGDEIIFTTAAGTFTYRMTRQEIVAPKDVWIVDPTPDATMTIFACHPPGSARQRIVVRGTLVQPAA